LQALVFDHFGGPEVYHFEEDFPVPEPGEGEVQIKIDGAGVNPVDWKITAGHYPPKKDLKFPAIPLRDFSGVVTKLGHGVTDIEIGDGVYGITDKGAAAEFTVAPTSSLAKRPPSMDAADAATIPLAGMTAWQALFDHGQIEQGQRVLIHAASGGVGTFAIQFAKWIGAYVVATASAGNFHLVQEIGADEIIDYKKQQFQDLVKDVDMVLHSIGQDQVAASLSVLRPGGRLICLVADPDEEAAKAQGKIALRFRMEPNPAQLRKFSDLIEDLKVRPVIDTIVPFNKTVEAINEVQEGHTVGKIGVRIRETF
jgi:NADPH:quinone reductase-like Zn-dependent oxidoreductase